MNGAQAQTPASAPQDAVWYYADGSNPVGPYTAAMMQDLIKRGTLKQDSLVWRQGMDNWAAANSVAELQPPAQPAPAAVEEPIVAEVIAEDGAPQTDELDIEVEDSGQRVTCPHCWFSFSPEHVKYIAQHEDLFGDPVAGFDAPLRFLPTRFSPRGHALDPKGVECQDIACPRCHLQLPRSVLFLDQRLISIIGAPSSGKSYYLAASIYGLRTQLTRNFAVSFMDADASSNLILRDYESTLFMPADDSLPVALQKTDLLGPLYNNVTIGNQEVRLAQPFFFDLGCLQNHPLYRRQHDRMNRLLVAYDNAGEHFEPNADSARAPGTRHLARSAAILFLYDPLQEYAFRRELTSGDPQLKEKKPYRQDMILTTALKRVRDHLGLSPNEKTGKPLYIVVTKWDAWRDMLPDPGRGEPVIELGARTCGYDRNRVRKVSDKLRDLFMKLCPDIVATAETASDDIVWIPVSALGGSPFPHPETGHLVVKPREIKPVWVTAPFLDLLSRWRYVFKPKKA